MVGGGRDAMPPSMASTPPIGGGEIHEQQYAYPNMAHFGFGNDPSPPPPADVIGGRRTTIGNGEVDRETTSEYSTIASDSSTANFAAGACEYMAKSVLDTFDLVGRGAVVVMDYAEKELCAPAVTKWNAHAELMEKVDRLNELLLKEKEKEDRKNRYNPFHKSCSTANNKGGDLTNSYSSERGHDVCSPGMMCGDDVVRSRSFFRKLGFGGNSNKGGKNNKDDSVSGGKKRGTVVDRKMETSTKSAGDVDDVVVDAGGETNPKAAPIMTKTRSRSLLRKILPGKSRKQQQHEEVVVGDVSSARRAASREVATVTVTVDSPRSKEGRSGPHPTRVEGGGDAAGDVASPVAPHGGGIQVKVSIVPQEEPPAVLNSTDDVVPRASEIENKEGDDDDAVVGSSAENQYLLDSNLGGALSREVDRVLHESVEMEVDASPGDNSLINTDDSFVLNVALSSPVSVSASLTSPSCGWCGLGGGNDPKKALEELKICSACQSAYYCGPECQSKDWINGHAEICRAASYSLRVG
jgi:hypothetical protein